jgi:DNA repair exonuclease SbcCD ATPase subunit
MFGKTKKKDEDLRAEVERVKKHLAEIEKKTVGGNCLDDMAAEIEKLGGRVTKIEDEDDSEEVTKLRMFVDAQRELNGMYATTLREHSEQIKKLEETVKVLIERVQKIQLAHEKTIAGQARIERKMNFLDTLVKTHTHEKVEA